MNAPTPNHDDDQPMREALRRDAARVPEPLFDAALHYATLRRVRVLAGASSTQQRVWLRPALVSAAAMIIGLAALAVLCTPCRTGIRRAARFPAGLSRGGGGGRCHPFCHARPRRRHTIAGVVTDLRGRAQLAACHSKFNCLESEPITGARWNRTQLRPRFHHSTSPTISHQ
jgi:hypothetical protein